jgi:hypothetical protein
MSKNNIGKFEEKKGLPPDPGGGLESLSILPNKSSGTNELFSTELTEADRELGFKLQEILNPDGHYVLEPVAISAVVLDLDLSHRIVKMKSPAGETTYKVQRFGKLRGLPADTKPGWSPCSEGIHIDPVTAANAAREFIAKNDPDFEPHIFGVKFVEK